MALTLRDDPEAFEPTVDRREVLCPTELRPDLDEALFIVLLAGASDFRLTVAVRCTVLFPDLLLVLRVTVLSLLTEGTPELRLAMGA